ncbi:MAG: UPF0182 family protein, partial [Angustibacter sp.]
MSFTPPWGKSPQSGRPVVERRRRGPLVPTIVILVIAGFAIVGLSQLWTNLLWFDSVGFSDVITTVLWAKVLLFIAAMAIVGGAVALSLGLAYKMRPIYAPVTPEQASLDRYREQIEPLRKLATVLLPIGAGIVAGAAASSQWAVVLQWWNRSSFGVKDPQFGIDIGFFVFTLPFLQLVLGILTSAVVLATVAGLVVHYLYGGLRIAAGGAATGPRTTLAARVQLSILLGLFLLVRAAGYWLDRYELTTESHALARDFNGMTYTSVNAHLPAKMFL